MRVGNIKKKKKGPASLKVFSWWKLVSIKPKYMKKRNSVERWNMSSLSSRTLPQIPGQTLSVHWQCWPAIRRCWRRGGRRRAHFLSSGCFWRGAPQLPAFSPKLHGSLSYRRYSLHSVTHKKKKLSDNCFIFLHLSTQLQNTVF